MGLSQGQVALDLRVLAIPKQDTGPSWCHRKAYHQTPLQAFPAMQLDGRVALYHPAALSFLHQIYLAREQQV